MKNILLISYQYPLGKRYCGGVGQMVKQSRQALLRLGHSVHTLITDKFNKRFSAKMLLPDGSVRRFPTLTAALNEHPWHRFDFIFHNFVNWARDLAALKKRAGTRPTIVYHFHSILRRERDSGFDMLNKYLLNQERMIEIADRII